MKQITSKKTGKIQIVSEAVWQNIVSRGWAKRFETMDLQELRLKSVPEILPPEVKTKTKRKNEQNN